MVSSALQVNSCLESMLLQCDFSTEVNISPDNCLSEEDSLGTGMHMMNYSIQKCASKFELSTCTYRTASSYHRR